MSTVDRRGKHPANKAGPFYFAPDGAKVRPASHRYRNYVKPCSAHPIVNKWDTPLPYPDARLCINSSIRRHFVVLNRCRGSPGIYRQAGCTFFRDVLKLFTIHIFCYCFKGKISGTKHWANFVHNVLDSYFCLLNTMLPCINENSIIVSRLDGFLKNWSSSMSRKQK